jgi:hypothetical protein
VTMAHAVGQRIRSVRPSRTMRLASFPRVEAAHGHDSVQLDHRVVAGSRPVHHPNEDASVGGVTSAVSDPSTAASMSVTRQHG